jgi:hypothetical protein
MGNDNTIAVCSQAAMNMEVVVLSEFARSRNKAIRVQLCKWGKGQERDREGGRHSETSADSAATSP